MKSVFIGRAEALPPPMPMATLVDDRSSSLQTEVVKLNCEIIGLRDQLTIARKEKEVLEQKLKMHEASISHIVEREVFRQQVKDSEKMMLQFHKGIEAARTFMNMGAPTPNLHLPAPSATSTGSNHDSSSLLQMSPYQYRAD
jgi:hypothetical protein